MAKTEQQTPEQIRQRGRELLQLAKQKEIEIKNKQLIDAGSILLREISNNWATPWQQLAAEIEQLTGKQTSFPAWAKQNQNQQHNQNQNQQQQQAA